MYEKYSNDLVETNKGVFIYKPEDDETISKQVFQRKTGKIGVFHDDEGCCFNRSKDGG